MELVADPDGMRRAAAKLRARAANIKAIVARLQAQVSGMAFAGPAADRFRSTVAQRCQGMLGAAAEMDKLADTFVRTAMAVEGQTGAGGEVR